MQLHKVNKEQRLYVMPCGAGYSCYGFDVLDRKARALTAELLQLGESVTPWTNRKGTIKAFNAYAKLLKLSESIYKQTGDRFACELTPQLVGLEGRRVEVITTYGEARRFWVGRSTGWCPCHLEIVRSNSHGGSAAEAEYKSVRVVSN
jgi:hypothetical protein